ncbi:HK97 gp10 family phage protein [Sphingomonas aerolata]|uniref:HK97 gp10 family phage protein n=1 Tax=Sphingomonas aerolata TaxID=185951 RepID=UPI002FE1B520
MATSRGGQAVRRYIAQLPDELEKTVLRGAARTGGKILVDGAKQRSISSDVDDAIVMKRRAEAGRITVIITVEKGWARSVANWLEYGTSSHFITVDSIQRGGMSVPRINAKTKEGSLVIGGQFVGSTVYHPGARPHPFLRPTLDIDGAAAVAAAQGFINAHVTRSGIIGTAEPEGEDA